MIRIKIIKIKRILEMLNQTVSKGIIKSKLQDLLKIMKARKEIWINQLNKARKGNQ
jgi:hypothetical protein